MWCVHACVCKNSMFRIILVILIFYYHFLVFKCIISVFRETQKLCCLAATHGEMDVEDRSDESTSDKLPSKGNVNQPSRRSVSTNKKGLQSFMSLFGCVYYGG